MENNFCRRNLFTDIKNLKKLDDNQFWQQVQGVLSGSLLKTGYDEDLYVPHNSSNKTIDSDIWDFISVKGDPTSYLLVGQYGSGKTSAINHFINIHTSVPLKLGRFFKN